MNLDLSLLTPPTEHRICDVAKLSAEPVSICTLIKAGKFPKSNRIGVRAGGWDSVEIEQWVAQRQRT